MLPKRFNLNHLDDGIRELVINLNRINGISTLTTCEGHIWRDVPAWPTKDGWVHFLVPVDSTDYEIFLSLVRSFCGSSNFFQLESPFGDGKFSRYTVVAQYEPHEDEEGNSLFEKMNPQEREEYFARADIRRVDLLKGWDDLNSRVVGYLKKIHGDTFSQLPYMDQ